MSRLDNSLNPMAITAPTGGVLAGGFVLIQGVLFYCPEAITAGQTGAGYWRDKRVLGAPKTAGATWTKGQKLYWDNTAGSFTTAATGNTLRVFAAADAGSADTSGDIEFAQIPA